MSYSSIFYDLEVGNTFYITKAFTRAVEKEKNVGTTEALLDSTRERPLTVQAAPAQCRQVLIDLLPVVDHPNNTHNQR